MFLLPFCITELCNQVTLVFMPMQLLYKMVERYVLDEDSEFGFCPGVLTRKIIGELTFPQ